MIDDGRNISLIIAESWMQNVNCKFGLDNTLDMLLRLQLIRQDTEKWQIFNYTV